MPNPLPLRTRSPMIDEGDDEGDESLAPPLMTRAGVDVRTIADILGHADPAMTLRRYAHVLPDMRERAASVIDGYSF